MSNEQKTPLAPASMGDSAFEGLKRTNEHGAEYWCARDLQVLLGYSQWRRFEQAIDRAKESCEQSGNESGHHFAGAGKMVGIGSGSQREVPDVHLSRFACYLIAQNGDPRKPEIAMAKYHELVGADCVWVEWPDIIAPDWDKFADSLIGQIPSGSPLRFGGGTLREVVPPHVSV